MASTFEQAEAALRDYQAMMGRHLESRYAFLNEFKSVDMSSPTAISQFAEIEARFDAKVDGENAELSSTLGILNSIVDNLPPDGFFGSAKADFKKKVDDTRAEIIKLNKEVRTGIGTIGIQVDELKKAAEVKTKTDTSASAPEEKVAAVNDDSKKETDSVSPSGSPSTQSPGSPVVNSPTQSSTTPGPTQNPLGNLSSYTYGLSLYMVNTDVTNQFIAGGGTMAGITGATRGVRVVAQSGGFGQTDVAVKSLDGTPMEYYIDDFNLTTFLPGGSQKATASTEIKFKINEPFGFTFLQDLTRAGFELNKEGNVNAPNMNGIQQHFIIGIKFYGYDINGNVITQIPANPKGGNANPEQLPERYFAIRITKVKFKLDGRMVSYHCDAVVMSESIANGQINGIMKSTTTLNGSTVWDVLANPTNKSSLVSVLNSSTATDKDSGKVKIPTKYSIEFLEGDKDLGKDSVIGKAKLVNDATFDNTLASTFKASDSEKSTIAQQFKAVSIDGSKVSIAQASGQNILAVIDNIIVKSEYISAALKNITTADAETKSKPKETTELTWYNVNPVVTAKDFDEQTNNWAYEIKFQIIQYRVPYVRTTNASKTSTYPGPSKKYDYWLTGTNSEIISYEQQYDNLFYMMTVASRDQTVSENQKNGSAPKAVQTATGGDTSGSQNKQFQFNASTAAQMYSPGDQAQVKIRIVGDPDYIMSKTGVNYGASLGRNKAGIDPLNGQVFIEIKFLMAVDYGANGLLNVSGNIQFYNDQIMEDLEIKGVVYKVIRVDSVFVKGSFTQTLTCILVDQRILSNERKSGSDKKSSADSSGNQRSEAATEAARLATKYPSPLNNQSDAETARLSKQNSSLIRPPSSVDLRTGQSSLAKGVEQILKPPPLTSKPTVTQIRNSPEYLNAVRSGVGSSTAYNNAEKALLKNVANDDQVKSTPSQLPDNRPRGDQ